MANLTNETVFRFYSIVSVFFFQFFFLLFFYSIWFISQTTMQKEMN